MMYNYSEDYLMHYGVKGMKWGVRRFQKKDGTLTPAGKKRIAMDGDGLYSKPEKRGHVMGGPKKTERKTDYDMISDAVKGAKKIGKAVSSSKKNAESNDSEQSVEKKGLSDKQKKALKVGAAVAGTTLAAYGAYKLGKHIQYNNSLKKAVEEGRQSVENNMAKHKSDPFAKYAAKIIKPPTAEEISKIEAAVKPTAEQKARMEAVRKADAEFAKRAAQYRASHPVSKETMEQLRKSGYESIEEFERIMNR